MAFDQVQQDTRPFPFNYCVDNELLTSVLTTEVYLIPFHKTRAAFGAIREQMISSNGFCAIASHRHAPSATPVPATATQLLDRYRHLVTNHPSRDVPATKHPFHEMQFNKRSRLLDQIFSRIINAIYPRGVGRPPRKYAFNGCLDVMLLEQVLQKSVHLLSRTDATPLFSAIRQYMIAQLDFPDAPQTPAPVSPAKGPPTVPQLAVRYHQLINNHVNATKSEETDVDRDPNVERTLHHLLDVIVRGIVKHALSGPDVINKDQRHSAESSGVELERYLSRRQKRRRLSAPARTKTEPEPEIVSPVTPLRPHRVPKVARKAATNSCRKDNDFLDLEPRQARSVPGSGRRVLDLEERRMVMEEEVHKLNRKRLAIEEERQKIDMQRLKVQENMLQQVQKEHVAILSVLSGITRVLSKISDKLEVSERKKEGNFLNQDAHVDDIGGPKGVTITDVDSAMKLNTHDASQTEKLHDAENSAEGGSPMECDGAHQKADVGALPKENGTASNVKSDGRKQEDDASFKEDDGTQKADGAQKHGFRMVSKLPENIEN